MVHHGHEISSPTHRGGAGFAFDEWQVCWLGGWGKDRLYLVVMLVKASFPSPTERA